MEVITKNSNLSFLDNIYPLFHIEKTLFFDIETTGFSTKNTKLYLIGCLYYDKSTKTFFTKQFFAKNFNDEPELLVAFFEFIKDFSFIVHYNGQGFDIPYMEAKCISYNLNHSFDKFTSIDLYKLISPIKHILKLENAKQKTVEYFLDIDREDKFSGKDLINIYLEYTKNESNELHDLLLLHNYEDIIGMVGLLPIINYSRIFENDYEVIDVKYDEYVTNEKPYREAIIECKLNYNIPKRISFGDSTFYFTAFNNTIKFKISIYDGGLKYFYPNYKDYYYLPMEDCSIHKSVAFYVDKNFRTKAKAANCYSKKTGRFLPQIHEIIKPYFKINYEDKTTYFELTDQIIKDYPSIKEYANDILKYLKSSKGW